MMKKMMMVLTVLVGLVVGGNDSEAATPFIPVVKENGFMVLKDKDPSRSTIVCVLSRGKFEDQAVCTNVYDKKDRVVLEDDTQGTEDAAIGEVVLLTFKGDWAEKIVYNTKRVGKYVNGQVICKGGKVK